MLRALQAISSVSPRAGSRRRICASVVVLSSLFLVCASVAPSMAQTGSAPARAGARYDSRELILEFDRLLAEKRHDEAKAVYEQLLASRADAVVAGLDLASRGGTSSELTTAYLCDLASDEVPQEQSTAVLRSVLTSPTLSDHVRRHCIHKLADRADDSFREPFLRIATDPAREVNLRVAALRASTAKWPAASHPTLVHLLRSAQTPIMHHKAQQYLALSGHPDALSLIEEFVLNRDPVSAGTPICKEYGLLLLRFRLQDGVVPLLASILSDETWPSEVQERAIDLLAHSDLSGGREVLLNVSDRAGSRLKSRIITVLTESE